MVATVINGQADLNALFADVVRDFQDMKFEPVMQAGFRMFEEESSVRFKKQESPEGVPWAPLSPFTIKKKGHAIRLYETGRLRGSLTTPAHGDGIRQTWDVWPKAGFIFGTDTPYGMFHETGGPNLPKRPFMGTTEHTLDKFTGLVADHALAELMQ